MEFIFENNGECWSGPRLRAGRICTSVLCCLVLSAIAWGEIRGQEPNATWARLQENMDAIADSRGPAESHSTSNGGAVPYAGKAIHPDPNTYIIGEQDSLVITVWKEKEISGGAVVRPDGMITVPLVGEIKVVGMTPLQLETMLAEKLKPYVTVPQVTVAVTEIRSRKVYLAGHAMRMGTYPINSSTTVLQLLVQAGGLTDFAKKKKIYVLRQQGEQQVRFPFNYDDVIKGKHLEQNIVLQPGDTVVVP